MKTYEVHYFYSRRQARTYVFIHYYRKAYEGELLLPTLFHLLLLLTTLLYYLALPVILYIVLYIILLPYVSFRRGRV